MPGLLHGLVSTTLNRLRAIGMPVGFLRTVVDGYTIVPASFQDDSINPLLNQMYLTVGTADELNSVAGGMGLRHGGATAVGTLYHEGTHAYLDLNAATSEVQVLTTQGERHYTRAPLRGGGTADDAPRLFQEAIASYVGYRAGTYYNAFLSLTAMREQVRTSLPASSHEQINAWRTALERFRNIYARGMSDRVYGYQMTGGFFAGQQTETTRPLSSAMRLFADERLLEGKLVDDLSQAMYLRSIYREIDDRLRELGRYP